LSLGKKETTKIEIEIKINVVNRLKEWMVSYAYLSFYCTIQWLRFEFCKPNSSLQTAHGYFGFNESRSVKKKEARISATVYLVLSRLVVYSPKTSREMDHYYWRICQESSDFLNRF